MYNKVAVANFESLTLSSFQHIGYPWGLAVFLIVIKVFSRKKKCGKLSRRNSCSFLKTIPFSYDKREKHADGSLGADGFSALPGQGWFDIS